MTRQIDTLAVMKLAIWNVNSIKARREHAQAFLAQAAPDVLMIQELKGEMFPAEAFEGYHSAFVGQKAYNGVAILSRTPIDIIHAALPGDNADEQARYLECDVNGLRVINIYLPNGNPVGTEKFTYKLAWMQRLYAHLKTLREAFVPFVIGGDFNVIPENKDCHDPAAWAGDALFQPESRRAFRKYLNLGLTDAFRMFDAGAKKYTFWDYQAGARQRNNGIRIDHFLLSPELADRAIGCVIDETPRDWDKPSDHTPVILQLAA